MIYYIILAANLGGIGVGLYAGYWWGRLVEARKIAENLRRS